MIHPWKDVPTGEQVPHVVNTIVEIPRGGTMKYELDKPTGMLRLDRVLSSAFHFPANNGFIPQTLGEGDDPLDILVLCQLPVEDPEYNAYEVIDDLPQHRHETITRFFRDHKQVERIEVDVRDLQPIGQAHQIIGEAVQRFCQ